MGKNQFFFGFVIAVLAGGAPAQALLFPLPHDEKEAYIMIREGALDSAVWNMVRQFYDQPLLVPLGELKLLADIFPGSFPAIPVNPRDLGAYEPWKKADIERFFRDFPELADFSPILRFETVRSGYHARIGSAFSKYHNNDPVIVSSIASRPAAVRFDARARFEATSARWQRRTLGIASARAGNLIVGNFNLNFDKGLFYGHFPSAPSDTDAGGNWRFAESNTWNGMLYESPEGEHASVAAFYHGRKSETACGARLTLKNIGRFRLVAAASRLMLPPGSADRSGELSFAHAGVDFSGERWSAGAIGGCERRHATAVPVILYCNHTARDAGRMGSARFEVLFARLPAGCSAVRGALFQECVEKTDGADSAEIDRSLVKTTCRIPVFPWMNGDCGAACYFSPGYPAAEAFTAVSGRGWLDYSLRYTFRPVVERSPRYRCIAASVGRAADRLIACRAYCRYIVRDESYRSLYFRLAADVRSGASMEISPFAAVYSGGGREREFSLGFSQTLRLFEKNRAEFKAEVPLVKAFQDQWLIDAKAFFYW